VYAALNPTVLDNGTYTAGSYTYANGQVTFTTAPTSGHMLSWFGYFYFGCEFVQDDLTLERLADMLYKGQSIKISSLRV